MTERARKILRMISQGCGPRDKTNVEGSERKTERAFLTVVQATEKRETERETQVASLRRKLTHTGIG